jgi:hypothetical protein
MPFTKHLIGATFAIAALVVSSGAAFAGPATFSVAGTSNPFLAGMPAGTPCCFGDVAPDESPVLAGAVTGGDTVSFTNVTGGVSFSGGPPTDGPNGNAGDLVTTPNFEGGLTVIDGIAGYSNAPVDALVGVFLTSALPTASPATTDLDFSSPTTTPGLQQVFFIGDGSLGAITVPTGATRLFLGTVDGFGWNNNSGAIDVTVGVAGVPEPAAWAVLLTGVVGLGGALRLARRRELSAVRA